MNLVVSSSSKLESSSDPVGIAAFAKNRVVARQHRVVHAIEDRCPHRVARLSLGLESRGPISLLVSWYEMDGDGIVIECAGNEQCLNGWVNNVLPKYPVKEIEGAIFLYFGDEANPEPCDLDLPKELVGEDFSNFLCTAMWEM